MNKEQFKELIRISEDIKSKIGSEYDIAFILGSGYGDIVDKNEVKDRVKYKDIPGFPNRMIKGQKGEILTTEVSDKKVIYFSGRFHYYQGYSSFEVTLPVRICKMLNVKTIIITNAAGGINNNFNPGDIMIIKDHINLMKNPLIGFSVEGYDLFIDMTEPYSKRLRDVAIKLSEEMGIRDKIKEGIYIATTGPSYETKAEIEFFKRIGADAVGMSTIPEVIVANQEGLEVFAISVITNMASGIKKSPLSHYEVLYTMTKTKKTLYSFLNRFLKTIIMEYLH